MCSYLVSMRQTKEGERNMKRELRRKCRCVEMKKKILKKGLYGQWNHDWNSEGNQTWAVGFERKEEQNGVVWFSGKMPGDWTTCTCAR